MIWVFIFLSKYHSKLDIKIDFRIIKNSHPVDFVIGFSTKLFLQPFEQCSPFRQRRSQNLAYFINVKQNAS